MKNKIIIVLAIAVLGIFFDDLAIRIAKLEQKQVDSHWLGLRFIAAEKKVELLLPLESRLQQVEQKLRSINPLQAKSNFTLQRLNLLEGLLEKTTLNEIGIKIFRTQQNPDYVETGSIGSHPNHQNADWGGYPFFRVGSVDKENIGRSFIRFKELTPEFLLDKKILAAVIYIKQTLNDSALEDDGAVNEEIDLFAVRKSWGQGEVKSANAKPGYVSWLSAKTQLEDWKVPGCSSPLKDFDPKIFGTTGPAIYGDSTEWVSIILTDEAIERMYDVSWPNNGYLLKMRSEGKPNTAVYFDSSKSSTKTNIPYMEIYYIEAKH